MNTHPSVNSPSPDRVSSEPMVRAQHTPGPWQSQHDNDRDGLLTIIGNVDGPDEGRYHYTLICDVVENASATSDEAVANARLIAAAPKLLAALRDLRRDEALDDDDARLVSTRRTVDALLRELGELA